MSEERTITLTKGIGYSLAQDNGAASVLPYEKLVSTWKVVTDCARLVLQPPYSNMNHSLHFSSIQDSDPVKYDGKHMFITAAGITEVTHRDIQTIIDATEIANLEVQEQTTPEGGIKRIFKVPLSSISFETAAATGGTQTKPEKRPRNRTFAIVSFFICALAAFFMLSTSWQSKVNWFYANLPWLINASHPYVTPIPSDNNPIQQ